MRAMRLCDVSLLRAGYRDSVLTGRVQALLESRTFLDSVVFNGFPPASRCERIDAVLLLAYGSQGHLPEFGSALRWFEHAVMATVFWIQSAPEGKPG